MSLLGSKEDDPSNWFEDVFNKKVGSGFQTLLLGRYLD